MAIEKSYTRLGLFLVIAIVVVLATGLLFIQRMRSREVIELVTYTQENVAGLDISSAVRYRGVPVGRVSNLQVEPGGRTIEIDFELFTDRLTTVGANVADLRELPTPISELRDRLPEVLERVEATLQVLRQIVARMPDSLDRADRFFTNVERIVRESELPALSADSRKFFSTTTAQFEAIASNLDGLVGDEGTLSKFADEARAAIDEADLPASGRATREAMDEASLAAQDLRRSLPAIRESLGQLRELARQLQEQPESVVHGVQQGRKKQK